MNILDRVTNSTISMVELIKITPMTFLGDRDPIEYLKSSCTIDIWSQGCKGGQNLG